MAKKVICILAAVVLAVSCFAVPTFAVNAQGYYDGYDYNKFPTLNAFPFPYPEPGEALNGKVNTSGQAIAIYAAGEGYNKNTACFILTNWNTGVLLDQVVTFSTQFAPTIAVQTAPAVPDGVDIRIEVVRNNGNRDYYVCEFFDYVTFSVGGLDKVNIYIRFEAYTPFPAFSFYPVLNYSRSPYGYQPYTNYYLGQQYDNGLTQGRQEGDAEKFQDGYNQGYQDAVDNVAAGVLDLPSMATITATARFIRKDNNVTEEYVINNFAWPVWSDISFIVDDKGNYKTDCKGFNLNYAIRKVKSDLQGQFPDEIYTFEDCTFVFSWADTPWRYTADMFGMRVEAAGSPPSSMELSPFDVKMTGTFLNEAAYGSNMESRLVGGYYPGDFMVFYLYSPEIAAENVLVTEFSLTVPDLQVLLSTYGDQTLVFVGEAYDVSYSKGFAQGYREGQESSLEPLKQQYIEQGRIQGYEQGRIAGLQQAEQGDFLSLMFAVVEAPVNVFRETFDFEILGFNLQNFLIALCSVAIAIFVCKKVGLF